MAVTYKFLQELPSKVKIQCMYKVNFSFNFGCFTIPGVEIRKTDWVSCFPYSEQVIWKQASEVCEISK